MDGSQQIQRIYTEARDIARGSGKALGSMQLLLAIFTEETAPNQARTVLEEFEVSFERLLEAIPALGPRARGHAPGAAGQDGDDGAGQRGPVRQQPAPVARHLQREAVARLPGPSRRSASRSVTCGRRSSPTSRATRRGACSATPSPSRRRRRRCRPSTGCTPRASPRPRRSGPSRSGKRRSRLSSRSAAGRPSSRTRSGRPVSARALARLFSEATRARTATSPRPHPGIARPAPAGTSAFELDPEEYPLLSSLGRNLTVEAEQGLLDPLVGRESELEQVLDILHKRRANNPCLIGDPGVGKTAIVEGGGRPPGRRGRAV